MAILLDIIDCGITTLILHENSGEGRKKGKKEKERERKKEKKEICKLIFIINSFEKSSVMILLSGLLYLTPVCVSV